MAVTVDDLLNQLAEDESRKTQLQIYFDASTTWVKNAITTDPADVLFFSDATASPLIDLAILSYAIDMWTHRSETLPVGAAVSYIIGQLRGLYSSWKEEQDALIQTQPT